MQVVNINKKCVRTENIMLLVFCDLILPKRLDCTPTSYRWKFTEALECLYWYTSLPYRHVLNHSNVLLTYEVKGAIFRSAFATNLSFSKRLFS